MKSKKNTIEITEQEILKPAEVIEPENNLNQNQNHQNKRKY